MDENVRKSWEGLLNPDLLRSRLIAASIYIAGYECLQDCIIGRIRDFYTRGFDESGDILDPKYQSDVLRRSKSPMYASLDWLKEMKVIDEADVGSFDRVKTCRNIIAHELFATIGSQGMPPDFEKCFREMVTLLRKIELWWIKEFEIPLNEDLNPEDIDESGIVPGPVMGLQLLCDIALGDEKTSRFYYNEFRKRTEGEKHK